MEDIQRFLIRHIVNKYTNRVIARGKDSRVLSEPCLKKSYVQPAFLGEGLEPCLIVRFCVIKSYFHNSPPNLENLFPTFSAAVPISSAKKSSSAFFRF